MLDIRQTQIDSFHDVKKSLGKRRAEVLDAIKILKNPTNTEISSHMKIPINQVTPRTNELVKLGLVIADGKVECSITHRTVMAWSIK